MSLLYCYLSRPIDNACKSMAKSYIFDGLSEIIHLLDVTPNVTVDVTNVTPNVTT